MKRFLATTAIISLTALPLAAEGYAKSDSMSEYNEANYTTPDGNKIRVSDLMSKTVYITREGETTPTLASEFTDAPDTWQDVADIKDILIGQDGQMSAIVLDAGGFLGMGEREVRIDVNQLLLIPDADNEGAYFAVYTGSKQLLDESEEYDEVAVRDEGYILARDLDQTTMNSGGMMDYDNMRQVLISDVTAEQLEGVRVYGSNDEWVGEIGELVLTADGKVETMIVDVGGFLGIGEKEVALGFDQVKLMRDENGGNLTGHVEMTEEQLEGMKEWEGASLN